MSDKPNLPAGVQQLVDSVTESRRRYVGTRSVNWCAYNDSGVRIAVIFPHPDGQWAVAGWIENPWALAPEQRHVKFTLETAKDAVQMRNPTTRLNWKTEEAEQAGNEFAPVEKAS